MNIYFILFRHIRAIEFTNGPNSCYFWGINKFRLIRKINGKYPETVEHYLYRYSKKPKHSV